MRTVNDEICETYREACYKHGLLENDQHWDLTLNEATLTNSPKQIRTLFAIILTTCAPSDPKGLWEKYKESLSEDILYAVRAANPNDNIQFSENIFNETLILLENKCIELNSKYLQQLGLPTPIRNISNVHDRDILREKQYNMVELRSYVEVNERLLTNDQKTAYETILHNINNNNGGIIFLDAPGGTGKTFLLNLILAKIRSQNEVAVAVASSGIASTLLDGGRTAHSTLKLPLNVNQSDKPTCNIGKKSGYIIKIIKQN